MLIWPKTIEINVNKVLAYHSLTTDAHSTLRICTLLAYLRTWKCHWCGQRWVLWLFLAFSASIFLLGEQLKSSWTDNQRDTLINWLRHWFYWRVQDVGFHIFQPSVMFLQLPIDLVCTGQFWVNLRCLNISCRTSQKSSAMTLFQCWWQIKCI